MPLNRRRFLASSGAALLGATSLTLPTRSRAQSGSKPRRLVVVLADGGWDVAYCMDPKPGLDTVDGPEVHEDPEIPDDIETLQTFGNLPVWTNPVKRPSVGRFFENWHDRVAVVNGIWMGAIAHYTARIRVLTGTQQQTNAAWSVIAGSVHGQDLPLGTVDLSGGTYLGPLAASAGQIGFQSQVKTLVLDDEAFAAPDDAGYTFPLFLPDSTDRQLLFDHLSARNEALRQRISDGGRNDKLIDDRHEAMLRASRFRDQGREAIDALRLGASPSLIEQIDLGIDLLKGDLCRTVSLDTRVFWDTHRDAFAQHSNFEATFDGVDYLATRLQAEGLLDDTLVVVLSEFTRTPTMNSGLGKDHWPHASFLLFGGNVMGNRVYGGTDDRLESLPIDLATGTVDPAGALNKYDNMAAGILAAMDIDPAEWYPTITPFTGCFG